MPSLVATTSALVVIVHTNPTLDGRSCFHPPSIFFVINLFTTNYMVPNALTFPNYRLFKFIKKKKIDLLLGVPKSGVLEQIEIYFSKIDQQIF